MKDLYPSRTGGQTEVMPRRDPVPWRSMATPWRGPLSEPELQLFAENGTIEFADLFSEEEIARFSKRVDELLAEYEDEDAPPIVREPDDRQIRSIFAVHRTDRLFDELSRDPRIVERVEQLLNSHVYIHQSRINLKPPFDGREFDWHSDFETWHVEDGMPRMRAVSCSIALTSNDEHNGPLLVIPGSHQYFVACSGRTPERHYEVSLRRQQFGVPDRESLTQLATGRGVHSFTGAPGALMMFECNLMHGSNTNITPWPRTNVFFVYNSVENTLQDPYSGQAPRPEHIASRDFTPVLVGD